MDEQSYGIENQIGAKLSGIRKEYDDFGKLCAVILCKLFSDEMCAEKLDGMVGEWSVLYEVLALF